LLNEASGPVAILNVGGVANVTYIGPSANELIAFDTGPGNALMDDVIYSRLGRNYDENGVLAAQGKVHQHIVDSWMALPFFALPSPKSLDRNSWDLSALEYLSTEDALATLAAFSVEAVAMAETLLPDKPRLWLVTGGGRRNAHFMKSLATRLQGHVASVDSHGWDGDCLEAEGFGYLAVRSKLGLPLSLPSTTGIPAPLSGGMLFAGR
jgi:anhydro-N-acetylmuramic acid kinase